ncbi:MAG: Ig-like domain-containing protein [Caldilineaceae bacterium]
MTQPKHGSVVLNGDGTLRYTATGEHNGVDSFTYTVQDGQSRTSTAAVAVAITAVTESDDAPQVEVVDPTQPNTEIFTNTQTTVVVQVPANAITSTASVIDVVFLASPRWSPPRRRHRMCLAASSSATSSSISPPSSTMSRSTAFSSPSLSP